MPVDLSALVTALITAGYPSATVANAARRIQAYLARRVRLTGQAPSVDEAIRYDQAHPLWRLVSIRPDVDELLARQAERAGVSKGDLVARLAVEEEERQGQRGGAEDADGQL